MGHRWSVVSTEIHSDLGYGIVKFNPLLLAFRPRVCLEFDEYRTDFVYLHKLISRRHLPFVGLAYRLPEGELEFNPVVTIQMLGRNLRIESPSIARQENAGVVRLPKSIGTSEIVWRAVDASTNSESEICRSADGAKSICVEKKALDRIGHQDEFRYRAITSELMKSLPADRRQQIKDPGVVWILGNAPSVNHLDLNKLASDKSFVIALNRFHLSYEEHNLREDLLISADDLVIKNFGEEIINRSSGLALFLTPKVRPTRTQPNLFTLDLNKKVREEPVLGEAQNISAFGSSLIAAIQIALLLGFRQIKLYGVDLSFDSFLDPLRKHEFQTNHHFIPNYRAGLAWNQPQWDRIMPGFVAVSLAAKVRGVEIVNYTPGHKFKMFAKGRI